MKDTGIAKIMTMDTGAITTAVIMAITITMTTTITKRAQSMAGRRATLAA
jgi:hypothetical protein